MADLLPTVPGAECFTCGAPATCIGLYEEMEDDDTPQCSCNDCCGHGGEDGRCWPIGSDEGRTRYAQLLGEDADERAVAIANTVRQRDAAIKRIRELEVALRNLLLSCGLVETEGEHPNLVVMMLGWAALGEMPPGCSAAELDAAAAAERGRDG